MPTYMGVVSPVPRPMDASWFGRLGDPRLSSPSVSTVASLGSPRLAALRSHRDSRLYNIYSPTNSPQLPTPASPLSLPIPNPDSRQHSSSSNNSSHASLFPTPAKQIHFAGPRKTCCPYCGVDPTLIYPLHPWDCSGSRWKLLQLSYQEAKPYLENKRKVRYRRKQRRLREGKGWHGKCRKISRKIQKLDLKRFFARIFHREHGKQTPEKKGGTQSPQEPRFDLVVTSASEPIATQDDRNVQGLEARLTREELVREPEARADGQSAASSDAGDCV